LLIASDKTIWVQDQALQTASIVIDNMPVAPRPTFRSDAEEVAFIGLDERGVEQIYVMDRRVGPVTQLTFHQDGKITDLAWAAG
jgi:hypothetical protein